MMTRLPSIWASEVDLRLQIEPKTQHDRFSGTECGQLLKRAQDTYYWVNPYDILNECYVPKKGSGRGPLDMSQMDAGDATEPTAAAATTAAMATWRMAMLGHTVPCADRRCVSYSEVHGSDWILISDVI